MGRQRHPAEQNVSKLREAKLLQANGMSIEEAMHNFAASVGILWAVHFSTSSEDR